MLGIEPLLIKAMPQLVQQAEKGLGEIVLTVAGGDARIARTDGAEEGVRGGVQPAAVKTETQGRGHGLAEDLLAIERIVAPQQSAGRSPRNPPDAIEEHGQLQPQRGE